MHFPRRPPLFRRLGYAFGWALTVFLGVIAVARVVTWDRFHVLVIFDAFTVAIYLPAWAVAVVAALRRRWFLTISAVAVAIAQILFLLPELTAGTPLPLAALRTAPFRLFDANVYNGNFDMSGYAAQISRFHPDLVTLEETAPWDRAKLQAAGVFRQLSHVFEANDPGSRAFIIASRYPLGPATVTSVAGSAFLVRTTLDLPTGTIPLWVVHTNAPVNPDWHLWAQQLAKLNQLLRQVRPRPLLMVGDFNSTWGNKAFRSILSTGLSDAAAARGKWYEMTWSQWWFLLPPMARIDHILTSPGIYVTTIRTGPGPGSDHRDLMATVAVVKSLGG